MADVVSTGPFPGLSRSGSETLYDLRHMAVFEYDRWTPQVIGSTSNGTCTYTNQYGYYTTVGAVSLVSFGMTFTDHTGRGNVHIVGYPGLPRLPSVDPMTLPHLEHAIGDGFYTVTATGVTTTINVYIEPITVSSVRYWRFIPRLRTAGIANVPIAAGMTIRGNVTFLNRLTEIEL